MSSQDIQEQTQYLLGKFPTQAEAEKTYKTLQANGFLPEKIFLEKEPVYPQRHSSQSQIKESARGGAIAGGVFGAIVGLTFSIMTNNLPLSATPNPTLPPLGGIVLGGLIGAVGIGLIGAITGRNVPKTKPGTDGEALTEEYKILLIGTEEDALRATEIVRQQEHNS